MRYHRGALFVAAGLLGSPAWGLIEFPDCVNGPLANNTVCNPKASPSDRAAALVKAMTLDEKLANLVNTSPGAPRIGLPAYEWWSEALHGVAGSPGVSFNRSGGKFAYATSFANPITLSAAFDDDLVEKVATVVSTEARAFSNAKRAGLDFWTPNINPYKDPRWGRGMETPGEDPLRIKGYVKSLLKGLEGNSSVRKVIATCKHYAAYDLERWHGILRYGFNAIVSLQDLSEYYLPPFQQCARDSKVGSIMCSYNALNGTPACANTYLMTDILREHWGWKEDRQFITSDCNAILDFYHDHNFSTNAAHAAGSAYAAGTDTVCEVPGYNATDVVGAYNQSLLSVATVDNALSRLYEGLVRAGYFDPPNSSVYRSLGWKDVNTAEAQALALQSAADGLVLKKNDGLLPLNLTNKTVAIIGHWAAATYMMLGGYSGIPPYYHNPLYAANLWNLTYNYAPGPVAQDASANDTWTAQALTAAQRADVVLYFGGNDLSMESEDRDRYNITWPAAQLDLITRLAALGKPTVVAQLGDQNDDTPLLRNANISAVLWAGYPGQDGGTAVLNTITGASAPAGRLPVTQYPGGYVDDVPLTDMRLRPGQGNPGRTYRWYDKAVLPFGHGLHYTTFRATLTSPHGSNSSSNGSTNTSTPSYAIADLVSAAKGCTSTHRDLCAFPAPVGVSVTNTGASVTSDFVALVFLAGEYGPAPYPLKVLAAYTRLRGIRPGSTATASLSLTLGTLARTDINGNLVLYPGTYDLLLDVPTQSRASFSLTGEAVVLDEFPQPGASKNGTGKS